MSMHFLKIYSLRDDWTGRGAAAAAGDISPAPSCRGALYTMPENTLLFCVFCTGKQMSLGHFTQFCNVTKIYIEIANPFIYNVTNWV